MLLLFEALYNYAGQGPRRFLLPEEEEDYQAAVAFRSQQEKEIGGLLAPDRRKLWETYLDNMQEAQEQEVRLAFRQGLALGLRLGSLTSWAP